MHQVHSQPVVKPVKGRGHIRTPSDIEAMRPAELRYAPTVGACLSWSSSCTAACCIRQSPEDTPTASAGIAQPQCCFLRLAEAEELLYLELCPVIGACSVMVLQLPCWCLRKGEAGPVQVQQQGMAALSLKQSCCVALSPPVLHCWVLCQASVSSILQQMLQAMGV